jgi:hypothetical protein
MRYTRTYVLSYGHIANFRRTNYFLKVNLAFIKRTGWHNQYGMTGTAITFAEPLIM